MKAMFWVRKWSSVSALVLLAACATPQPIRDLAGQGAASVGLAEISLREYVALTYSQLAARMDLIRYDVEQEAHDRARREFDSFIDRTAGLPARDEAISLFLKLGNESRQIHEREAQDVLKIAQDSTLDATLTQVPTEKLAAAQKSFSILAQELSPSEWLALAAGYAKEIRAGVVILQAALKDRKSDKQ
jgi:hypothetical protein